MSNQFSIFCISPAQNPAPLVCRCIMYIFTNLYLIFTPAPALVCKSLQPINQSINQSNGLSSPIFYCMLNAARPLTVCRGLKAINQLIKLILFSIRFLICISSLLPFHTVEILNQSTNKIGLVVKDVEKSFK